MVNELREAEIEEIKRMARSRIGEYRKSNDIIGIQIFSILGLNARAIFYPLGKDAPWGFTRMSGSRNDSQLKKPFVAINSSIPKDCQVFAAAHELYHIWYEQSPDYLPQDLLDDSGKKVNEKMANRFAAEFLVDEGLLEQELKLYGIQGISVKDILQMSELFVVPYRTMVKRLFEIGKISLEEEKKYLEYSEEDVTSFRKRYAFCLQEADEVVKLDRLVELSVEAYEKGLITFEKLEYLLNRGNLSPADLHLVKAAAEDLPSDEELDDIMGDYD